MAGKGVTARPRRLDHDLFVPVCKAYLLAYLSSAGPRFASLGLAIFRRKPARNEALVRSWRILKQTAAWDRFPAFCAVLVGGSISLQIPLRVVLQTFSEWLRRQHITVRARSVEILTRFLAAFVAASIGFAQLNSRPSQPLKFQAQSGRHDEPEQGSPKTASTSDTPVVPPSIQEEDAVSRYVRANQAPSIPPLPADTTSSQLQTQSLQPLAGRTMDLTLFAVIRALDIIISPFFSNPTSRSTRMISTSATPTLFAIASATIMRAWFYTPTRLPSAYNAWISSAAQLDLRLLLALRHARAGTFVYGHSDTTRIAPLLGSMCRDYQWPESWGDPGKTVPVPCEMVHQGCGPSCEKHALWRLARGWLFAARMYVPLQLLVFLKRRRSSRNNGAVAQTHLLLSALSDAARSSAFLGAFVALFYYGVCLSRTRLGPRIFSPKTVSPQMWDSGLCVLAGSALCGWSVLLEKARRRTEILFFVLPRAVGVWFPRRYLEVNRWREHLAFAVSAAVVLTAAQEQPSRVRGVLGKVLGGVMVGDSA